MLLLKGLRTRQKVIRILQVGIAIALLVGLIQLWQTSLLQGSQLLKSQTQKMARLLVQQTAYGAAPAMQLQNDELLNELELNHPKLRSLTAKIEGLAIDRRLKRNKLLPKLDLQYNFLNQEAEQVNTLNTANYKVGVNFSFPLFLRKERGEVQLAKYKLQDATFERMSVTVELQNKIEATRVEIASLTDQNALILDMVDNYRTLLTAEERKFELGESSLFLINSREQKLIEILLKANALQVKSLHANASLFNVLGVTIE